MIKSLFQPQNVVTQVSLVESSIVSYSYCYHLLVLTLLNVCRQVTKELPSALPYHNWSILLQKKCENVVITQKVEYFTTIVRQRIVS